MEENEHRQPEGQIQVGSVGQIQEDIAKYATNGIYVIRRADFQLLYMNRVLEEGLRETGVAAACGRKCYEVLRGRTRPCEDCPVCLNRTDEAHYEMYNERLRRFYTVMAHEFSREGQARVAVYLNDITEARTSHTAVERVYNNIPGAVFSCRFDDNWSVIEANDGLFLFLGYSREEFAAMGNCMGAVIYPDDGRVMKARITDQLSTGKTTVENENRLVCKDGTIKWISIRGQLLKDENGLFFYCVFVDISKQKTEELRIRESQDNLAIAMQHAGMLYWEYDIPAGAVRVSKATQEWFGLPEYLADYPESYLALGFVAEEYVPLYRDSVSRVRAGEPYVEFDARIRTLHREYEWMRVRLTGVTDEKGQPIRAICTAEVIAEYKDLENRFTTTLRQNQIASWRYDVVRHTILLNDRSYYAFDRSPQGEVPDVPESQIRAGLCHPDDVENFRRLYRRMDEGERRVEEVLRFRDSKTLQYRWKRCVYTVLEDSKGAATYAVGSAIDIQEEMEAQRKYEMAVAYRKHTQTDHLVLSCHGSVTEDRLLEMTDRSGADLQVLAGGCRSTLCAALEKMMVDRERAKEFRQRFMGSSVIKNFNLGIHEAEMTCEVVLPGERGRRMWLSLHLDVVKAPQTGHIEDFMMLVDVTEAHIREQLLGTVIHCDYDYVASVCLRADAMVLYRNGEEDRRISRYTEGMYYSYCGFVETACAEDVLAEEQEDFRNNMRPERVRDALKAGDVYEFVVHVRLENGELRAKRGRFAAFDEASDTVVFTRSDVTEVLAQQEALNHQLEASIKEAREANRAKSVFLSRVSHDMRTPLNGILGLTALMQEKSDWSEIQSDLAQLKYSGEYLLNVINDTLDVAKIENGRMELQPTICDQRSIMDAIQAILKSNLENGQITLRTHVEDRPSRMLNIDVGRFEQLITNIIGNSIKFTPPGGFIDVTVQNVEETPTCLVDRFTISDTGVGMKPEFLPHLFEAFSQEDTSRTTRNQGTGLGMSIAREIVTLMGGQIHVESTVGKGTTFDFTLRLPLATPEQVADWQQRRSKAVDQAALKGRHILLCEDHPLNAQIAIRLLERRGMQVDRASDGEEGVRMFEASPVGSYDLILMDIRMPLMDGLEATRVIRGLRRADAATVPILAMTANALSEDVAECMRAGMNGHIAKPIQPTVMFEAMAQHIK